MVKVPTSFLGLALLLIPISVFMLLKIAYIGKQIRDGKKEGKSIQEILRDGSDLTSGSVILDAAIFLLVVLIGFFGISAILNGMHNY